MLPYSKKKNKEETKIKELQKGEGKASREEKTQHN
jgi:hypothetical protein